MSVDKLTFDLALQSLTRIQDERRLMLQLTPAVERIGEILQAAKQAEATLETFAGRKVELAADIDRLSQRKAELQESVGNVESKLVSFRAELEAKENEKRAALAVLDEQIRAKGETLARVMTDYEQFRAAHKL